METDLDKIEAGKMAWKDVLREYYKDFDANLNNAEIQLEGKHLKVPDEESDEVCPNCGRKLVYKNGRFGRFLACPGYPECSFTMPFSVRPRDVPLLRRIHQDNRQVPGLRRTSAQAHVPQGLCLLRL